MFITHKKLMFSERGEKRTGIMGTGNSEGVGIRGEHKKGELYNFSTPIR